MYIAADFEELRKEMGRGWYQLRAAETMREINAEDKFTTKDAISMWACAYEPKIIETGHAWECLGCPPCYDKLGRLYDHWGDAVAVLLGLTGLRDFDYYQCEYLLFVISVTMSFRYTRNGYYGGWYLNTTPEEVAKAIDMYDVECIEDTMNGHDLELEPED